MRASTTIAGAAIMALAATSLSAQPRQVAAVNFDELPAGEFRASLETLPGPAQQRARAWLNDYPGAVADAARLRADPHGGIYYVDDAVAETGSADMTDQTAYPLDITEVFNLHSKPGAARVLFVDFDGHVITGTAWNSGRADPLYAVPYDTDGVPGQFSADERSRIAEIWYRVSEDFAAFDIDVTTEPPTNWTSQTGHLLITDDVDLYGNAMPAQGAGGVAYLGPYGYSNYDYYSPALVYAGNLGPDFPPYVAEAASHEFGHNLGLAHDGTSTSGYYPGHGSGNTSWGPIMGTGYNDNVSQWSRGEYADANNLEDDLALMEQRLSPRADDHGNTPSAASLLVVDGSGAIVATQRQSDPFNLDPENKGIIGLSGDKDLFSLQLGSGPVSIQVTPSWAAWERSSGGRGTNLDVLVRLLDTNGTEVTRADALDDTDALISTNVAGGTYYLEVSGVGNDSSPYSAYGSQGQYHISGQVTVGEPDTTAPTPDPMAFAQLPAAQSANSISMQAQVAIDESGSAVQYEFVCSVSGSACAGSGWQSSTSYLAQGLAAETSYGWQVRARDASGNATQLSPVASATTFAAPAAPETPGGLMAVDNADGTTTLTWADLSNNEESIEVQRDEYHSKRNRWKGAVLLASLPADTQSYTDAGVEGLYRYRVRSVNATGASAWTPWAEINVTNASGGGGGKGGGGGDDGSCKGGPKKCPG